MSIKLHLLIILNGICHLLLCSAEGCDVRIQLPSVRPQHCRIDVDLADEKVCIVQLRLDINFIILTALTRAIRII